MLPWPISKVASKWLSLHPTGACTNLPWDWPVQNTDNHMYYLGANVQTRLRVLTIVYNYSLGFVALPGVCRHLELSKWNGSSVQDGICTRKSSYALHRVGQKLHKVSLQTVQLDNVPSIVNASRPNPKPEKKVAEVKTCAENERSTWHDHLLR